MPQRTQAQKLVALREIYAREAQELSSLALASLPQTQGRLSILTDIVTVLAHVTSDLSPDQVQVTVQPLFKRLGERKAACVAFAQHYPQRYGIDAFTMWRMDGERQQIDQVWTQVCSCFSPRWRTQPWQHGCHFQAYHSQTEHAAEDNEVMARWQSKKRALWFWEVAIIEVAPARTIDQRLEEVFLQTNHLEGNWTQGQAVFWVQSGMPLRSTSRHDVIVSVLSGSAWMVDRIGFQSLA